MTTVVTTAAVRMLAFGEWELVGRDLVFFFFNDTATTEIYTLSLHDALPIYRDFAIEFTSAASLCMVHVSRLSEELIIDRKSTRLNSSHLVISYAVFCLKKKNLEPAGTGDLRGDLTGRPGPRPRRADPAVYRP